MTDQTAEPINPAEPILDLSTLAPIRPTINIETLEGEGEEARVVKASYALRLLERDFSAAGHAEFQRDLGEFEDLWQKAKRSKNEDARMSKLLDVMARVVLDAPDAVIAQLSDEQKRQVVIAFQYAPALAAAQAQQTEKAAETESRSTTGT